MNQNSFTNKEVEKFSTLAEEWWDINGKMQTLHHINPTRLKFIKSQLALTNATKILDVGCGAGILSESLVANNCQIDAIDLSVSLIEVAKQHAKDNNLHINYVCDDIFTFASSHKQSYDCITCMELLEHVETPEKFIIAMQTMLKPNGLLFISTLNKNFLSYIFAIGIAEYLTNIVPKGTHQFKKFITPAQLDTWCRSHNLELIAINGIQYNPLTKSAKLTTTPTINYITAYKNI